MPIEDSKYKKGLGTRLWTISTAKIQALSVLYQGFIWAKNFEGETGAMAGIVGCL